MTSEVTRTSHREYMRQWRKTDAGRAWEARVVQRKRERVAADPEKYKAQRREAKFKHRYGITTADYDDMLRTQHGVCAVCGRVGHTKSPLHVDHDHSTGEIRGLLCVLCNRALGYVEEDPARLAALLEYIEIFSA